VKTNN